MDWRKSCGVVIGIQIKPSPNLDCANAKDYVGYYKLEDAPDYPFGSCEMEAPGYEFECCCWWASVLEGEEPEGGWKVPKKRHPMAGSHIEVPEEPMTEKRVRRLAEVLNAVTESKIGESDIQTALVNGGTRKPKGLLEKVLDWFGK